ncbi:hypothetical protein KKH07_01195 [Patescibacteria group bacterium]|nr:hypothetical protein [Patescibacteria group bacterium]MBU2068146.1 hypothetical protein [Patescibacteria group bacterium]
MQQIIVGTKNKAKLAQIKGALASLQLNIVGLSDNNLPSIEEDGKTAQENAKKKALVYAKVLGQPVLSMDNALYFEGLSDEEQPGINVRRIKGRSDRPTDNELLEYYSKLVEELGDKVNAHWDFAICFAYPDEKVHETTIVSPRIFTSKISSKVIEGYPLESIQIDPKTDKYISEMTQEEQDVFWQEVIGKKLCQFIKSII